MWFNLLVLLLCAWTIFITMMISVTPNWYSTLLLRHLPFMLATAVFALTLFGMKAIGQLPGF